MRFFASDRQTEGPSDITQHIIPAGRYVKTGAPHVGRHQIVTTGAGCRMGRSLARRRVVTVAPISSIQPRVIPTVTASSRRGIAKTRQGLNAPGRSLFCPRLRLTVVTGRHAAPHRPGLPPRERFPGGPNSRRSFTMSLGPSGL